MGRLGKDKTGIAQVKDDFEESYVLSDEEIFEFPKSVFQKLRAKTPAWFRKQFQWDKEHFNDARCENLDMIATYRPYHFNGETFGLYIYGRYFASFFMHILEKTRLPFVEARTFAFECVLSHGAFHYLIERHAEYDAFEKLKSGFLYYPYTYLRYKAEVYSRIWGTEECLEETLANAFLLTNHPEWDEKRRSYLLSLFQLQRDGYAQAAELQHSVLPFYYRRLEALIGSSGKLSLEQWVRKNTPFHSELLPVYVVNDCTDQREFAKIIELLFPGLDEQEG